MDVPAPELEADKVRGWQRKQLLKLGFDEPDVSELLDREVDYHELEHLIRDLACPPGLAKRIIQ